MSKDLIATYNDKEAHERAMECARSNKAIDRLSNWVIENTGSSPSADEIKECGMRNLDTFARIIGSSSKFPSKE